MREREIERERERARASKRASERAREREREREREKASVRARASEQASERERERTRARERECVRESERATPGPYQAPHGPAPRSIALQLTPPALATHTTEACHWRGCCCGERECCLLVLSLVSSTLPCIRQPRLRPRVLGICGFVLVCTQAFMGFLGL